MKDSGHGWMKVLIPLWMIWQEEHGTQSFSSRNNQDYIVRYMRGDKSNIMPIMTNSESIYQFGANAYGKPTVALNILRDTIMGRELFDFAFKEYSKTWMFKHQHHLTFSELWKMHLV